MYAQFSTRNGHKTQVNQVWTEREPIFHWAGKGDEGNLQPCPWQKAVGLKKRSNGHMQLEFFEMMIVCGKGRGTRAKILAHVSTVTPALFFPSTEQRQSPHIFPFILPFPHGWRRRLRHLGRGQASCRTLSASILLVHSLRRGKAFPVLPHVSSLRPLPSYLLSSLPPLAGD